MKILRLLALSVALVPFLATSETFTLQTRDWCPFVCQNEKDHPGFVIEVLKNVLAKDGHNLELEFVQTEDENTLKERTKINYLFGPMSKTDDTSLNYLPIEFANTKQCFYVLKDDEWEFYDFKNLTNRKIKYNNSNPQKLDFIVFQKYNSTTLSHYRNHNELSSIINELIDKKIDTIFENPIVFNYYSEKEDLRDKFAEVGCINGDNYYLGYRPKKKDSKNSEKLFLKRIQELKDSETIDKIIKKYHLKDWRP